MTSHNISLDGPIVPNRGLAGLTLRTRIEDIQDLFSGLGVTQEGSFELVSPFDARYHVHKGEVAVCVDVRNGKVFMLSACNGYRGSVFGKIFVGMRVKDAMDVEPRLHYDEAEEAILCKGCEGLSMDVSAIDPPVELVPEMTICAINVFAQEINTLQGQKGRW